MNRLPENATEQPSGAAGQPAGPAAQPADPAAQPARPAARRAGPAGQRESARSLSGTIVITGANGFVGRATATAAHALGLHTVLTDRTTLDRTHSGAASTGAGAAASADGAGAAASADGAGAAANADGAGSAASAGGAGSAASAGGAGAAASAGGAGAAASADGVEVVVADLTDAGAVEEVIGAAAPVAVVHLAAYGEGGEGLAAGAAADPGRAVHVNVCGFMNVLRACANVGARLVWSSSTTVFGPAADYPGGPVTENAPRTPQSVYGATKAACEDLARLAGPSLGVPVAGLRLPLVYGPGRWYGGSQETLVRFVTDLAAGRDAHIHAWDTLADWIHVDDAASALLLAATAPTPAEGIYHVVGHRSSLTDLATALATTPHSTSPPCNTAAPNNAAIDHAARSSHVTSSPEDTPSVQGTIGGRGTPSDEGTSSGQNTPSSQGTTGERGSNGPDFDGPGFDGQGFGGGGGTVVGGAAGGPDLPLTDDSRLRAELGFRPRHSTPQSGALDYLARARA